ncbi:MAG: RNA methyltransferase [Lachnospiraceae bacterium]|nr:RNA methyltransferase [Lachnospiraceae bacterium]
MNFIEIKDIYSPELDVFSRLSEAQLMHFYEPDLGVFIAESANVILRSLEAGYEPISLLLETQRVEKEGQPVFDKIRELFGEETLERLPVYVADHEIVTLLTGYSLVRGLWAVLRRRPLPDLKSFCEGKRRLAVLVDVVNPTNVGAIIRSAAALGMDGVLLTEGTVDPLTRRSARVSMGTVFQIPWCYARPKDREDRTITECLANLGFQTVAMALTTDCVSIEDERLKAADKLAILLGTEGDGLPKSVIDDCTYRVKIPMYYGVDSLNVAAASAVAFWELGKKS